LATEAVEVAEVALAVIGVVAVVAEAETEAVGVVEVGVEVALEEDAVQKSLSTKLNHIVTRESSLLEEPKRIC
jgi:hypothetical protein